MRFALVNGERQEAQPDLKGKCPDCDGTVIARCGEIKIWHWAHKGRQQCDYSREPETPWHRAWKNHFPDNWQEIRHDRENGVWFRADVTTDEGLVIEFQHSYLKPEVRRARDAFYDKIVWVVDGTRRKTDRPQFLKALEEGSLVGGNRIVKIAFWDECRLLREWAESQASIFFDFDEDVLWWLFKSPNGTVYVAQYPRNEFIKRHHDGGFEEELKKIKKGFAKYEHAQAMKRELVHLQLQQVRPDPLLRIQQSYAYRGKRRRRL